MPQYAHHLDSTLYASLFTFLLCCLIRCCFLASLIGCLICSGGEVLVCCYLLVLVSLFHLDCVELTFDISCIHATVSGLSFFCLVSNLVMSYDMGDDSDTRPGVRKFLHLRASLRRWFPPNHQHRLLQDRGFRHATPQRPISPRDEMASYGHDRHAACRREL